MTELRKEANKNLRIHTQLELHQTENSVLSSSKRDINQNKETPSQIGKKFCTPSYKGLISNIHKELTHSTKTKQKSSGKNGQKSLKDTFPNGQEA